MPLDEQERALWEEYAFDSRAELRTNIIEFYLPFAEAVARQHDFRDVDVPLKELQQLAYVGLLEAVDRFDYEREASFRTFASFRIKGAILNGIEKASEKRAQMALRKRVLSQRTNSLADADNTFEKLAEIAVGLAIGFMLEDSRGLFLGDAECAEAEVDDGALCDLQRELARGIEGLPEGEKTVICRHYFDGADFVDIAASMGVTRGRISQLHKSALARLKQLLSSGPAVDGTY